MSMRKGNSLILILAIVMGLGAAYLARDWVNRRAVAVPAQTGTVVVAGTRMAFGTELTRDNVVEIPWGAATLPEGAFATKATLFKEGRRVVLAPIERSELIVISRITGPGQRASLSALLAEGHRAVTIRVDDVRGVAGFVLPGDRVDVVLIRSESQGSGRTENSSNILVQHVKVLAVDQLVNERQEKATVARAVTLEVTTEQAQKILLATNVGRLSLILRQAGQGQPEASRRITDSDLYASAPAPSAAAPAAAAQPATAVVDIVRGTRRETYNVQRSVQ
jgi:pilus assembly protein CpaB